MLRPLELELELLEEELPRDDEDPREEEPELRDEELLEELLREETEQEELHACTDITGFGLLGHLGEMLKGASTGAYLQLDALPVLEGSVALAQRGFESTLAPDNRHATRLLENPGLEHPHYPLMFDPQTAGGLLAAVPAEVAMACGKALRDAGYPASIIGNTSGEISHGAIRLVG